MGSGWSFLHSGALFSGIGGIILKVESYYHSYYRWSKKVAVITLAYGKFSVVENTHRTNENAL
jgi:hypothetical protein